MTGLLHHNVLLHCDVKALSMDMPTFYTPPIESVLEIMRMFVRLLLEDLEVLEIDRAEMAKSTEVQVATSCKRFGRNQQRCGEGE